MNDMYTRAAAIRLLEEGDGYWGTNYSYDEAGKLDELRLRYPINDVTFNDEVYSYNTEFTVL